METQKKDNGRAMKAKGRKKNGFARSGVPWETVIIIIEDAGNKPKAIKHVNGKEEKKRNQSPLRRN